MDPFKIKRMQKNKCINKIKSMQKILLNQFLNLSNSRDKHRWDYCSRILFISQTPKLLEVTTFI